ncbi:unnamed protein product [Arabidopsis halleri]
MVKMIFTMIVVMIILLVVVSFGKKRSAVNGIVDSYGVGEMRQAKGFYGDSVGEDARAKNFFKRQRLLHRSCL